MIQIGDKKVTGNPEDLFSLYIIKVSNIYELSKNDNIIEISGKLFLEQNPVYCNTIRRRRIMANYN